MSKNWRNERDSLSQQRDEGSVREALRIAVAQPRCVSHDVAANVEAHVELIRAARARVVVFPDLGLAICRDTGIAEHARRTAALDIHGYVAGVVHSAEEAAVHGERARNVATEHGVWAATAAFAGPTGGGFPQTSGRSGIWSATGELLAEAGKDPGELACHTFEPGSWQGRDPIPTVA
ncbi:hypothetical protein [Nocardia sp. NPDC059229]|uniref:hypothetical protein n=1 Tax=Nocardia sp. NPDC059229 TaxID=3346778 RepID=UPI0036C2EBDC